MNSGLMVGMEDMGAVMRVADTLAKSALIPDKLRGKPADVLVVLLTGRELGLQPMQALRSIYVWNGKPTMSADLMQAICLSRREVCARFQQIESTAERATYEAQRAGCEPVRLTWTKAMAQVANLLEKDTWKTYPDAMLRARCKAALARDVFPDLMAGLYTPEELNAEDVAAPTVATVERPVLPAPTPRETLTASPKREPVPRMTLEQAMDAPSGSFPRGEVVITDLPPREPGSDDAEAGPDPMTAEVEDIERKADAAKGMAELEPLKARALRFADGTEERKRLGRALTAAWRRVSKPDSKKEGAA